MDYNCDIEHVVSILQEVVKQNKLCLDDPAPVIMFTGFQDSSLGFKIGAWCLKDNFLDCQKTLAHDIKHRFAAEAFPSPSPPAVWRAEAPSRWKSPARRRKISRCSLFAFFLPREISILSA